MSLNCRDLKKFYLEREVLNVQGVYSFVVWRMYFIFWLCKYYTWHNTGIIFIFKSIGRKGAGRWKSDGRNPTKVTLKRKTDHVLVFNKEGYEQEQRTVMHVVSGAECTVILLQVA